MWAENEATAANRLSVFTATNHDFSFWGLTREIPHSACSSDETADACPDDSLSIEPPGRGSIASIHEFSKGDSYSSIIKCRMLLDWNG